MERELERELELDIEKTLEQTGLKGTIGQDDNGVHITLTYKTRAYATENWKRTLESALDDLVRLVQNNLDGFRSVID